VSIDNSFNTLMTAPLASIGLVESANEGSLDGTAVGLVNGVKRVLGDSDGIFVAITVVGPSGESTAGVTDGICVVSLVGRPTGKLEGRVAGPKVNEIDGWIDNKSEGLPLDEFVSLMRVGVAVGELGSSAREAVGTLVGKVIGVPETTPELGPFVGKVLELGLGEKALVGPWLDCPEHVHEHMQVSDCVRREAWTGTSTK
jgi:hypothetical protein